VTVRNVSIYCYENCLYIFKLKNERVTLPTHTVNHVQQIIATFLKINTCNQIAQAFKAVARILGGGLKIRAGTSLAKRSENGIG